MLQMMQPAAKGHAGQGETGELQQLPQRLQSQQATLFPPSYFKEAATSPQTEAVPVGDEHTASAPVLKPRDDGRPLNQREAVEGREKQIHLATLRLQNQALRCRGHILIRGGHHHWCCIHVYSVIVEYVVVCTCDYLMHSSA